MKKYFYFSACLLVFSTIAHAQVKVGAPGAADPSASLEVTAGPGNNKGLLLPRLTTAQRNAISLPATGLTVYNTTDNQLQVNMGTPQVPVWTLPVSNDAWKTGGNAGTGAGNFLGTTDAQPLVIRTANAERVRVDANGNVGLGVAAPSAQLQFNNALTARKLALWSSVDNNPHRFFGFGVEPTTFRYQVNNAGDDHVFFSGLTDDSSLELMRVKGNGNVGIGTSAPSGRLSVAGPFNAYSAFTMHNTAAANATAVTVTPGFDMAAPVAGFTTFDMPGTGAFTFGDNVVPAGGMQLGFADRRWAGLFTTTLDASGIGRIGGSVATNTITSITGRDATGNIGNIVLGAGLAFANGTLSATGTGGGVNIYNSDGTLTGPRVVTQGEHHLVFNGSGGINFNSGRMFMTPQAVGPKLTFIDQGANHFGFAVSNGQVNYHVGGAGDAHVFYAGGLNANGTELMRVGGNGNVGIGTAVPAGRLSVAGPFIAGAGLTIHNTSPANATSVGITPGFDGSSPVATSTTFDMPGTGSFIFGDNVIPTGAVQLGLPERRWAAVNSEFLNVNNLGRIGGSVPSNTITSITGRDDTGNIGSVTLGTGLSFVNGVLSSTATDGGTPGWSLTGNAGTNPATNFLGTTDAQPLWFRTANTNQMVLTTAGFLGLNTSNPRSRLSIVSNSVAADEDISIERYAGGDGTAQLAFLTSAGTEAAPADLTPGRILGNIIVRGRVGGQNQLLNSIRSIYRGNGSDVKSEFRFLTSGSLAITIDERQYVGIGNIGNPTERLHVDGNVLAANFVQSSDVRLKKDIANLTKGLDEVMKVRPVSYKMKKDLTGANQLGFIAQELEKVVPEVVVKPKSENGFYAVNYAGMVPVLTKAIQEQQSQIEQLKAENAALKSQLAQTAELTGRVRRIEQMLKAQASASTMESSK